MTESSVGRAGYYVPQLHGTTAFRAFIPAPLPPQPPIHFDEEMANLLSNADQALGRLDGIAPQVPNPDYFIWMFARKEAVLSSQIEGTQSTLDDLLLFELDDITQRKREDTQETANYLVAMRYGLDRLPTLPLSQRLIREIHEKLMQGVRGKTKTPGEFRTTQNWIGRGGTLADAIHIPPPVHEMQEALQNWEKFLHEKGMPTLILCALAHAQFETIHPFLDGNGRVGRLLITLLLCERKNLHHPVLYLSSYLKGHESEYYDRLQAVRERGDWEGWIKFFLKGVAEVSQKSFFTARNIQELRENLRKGIGTEIGGKAQTCIDLFFERPYFRLADVQKRLQCTHPTATKIVNGFEKRGLVKEITGAKRNRIFRYGAYIDLFNE